ncbi:hypothetical protein QE152_g36689 [Popillia japonica]|uniref:HTH CENPB-type domain-containing protein n=1 Tax=Popillia japonica TaxID=7064 RepID=A0AAW1ICJ2_POPJA
MVRRMAYDLAEQLNIGHSFNRNKGLAGRDWLRSFLTRNPDLAFLEDTISSNSLFNKPGNIFNMDETGCQLNNKPQQVVAAKGSKNVVSITSAEKGETISVVVCCNGEGWLFQNQEAKFWSKWQKYYVKRSGQSQKMMMRVRRNHFSNRASEASEETLDEKNTVTIESEFPNNDNNRLIIGRPKRGRKKVSEPKSFAAKEIL